MKNQNLQDERIVSQHRKIKSDAFSIVFFILLISVVVQQSFLNAPFEQFAVELICLVGMAVYMTVRYLALGLDLFDEGKQAKYSLVVNTLAISILATVIHGVLNYTRNTEHYADNLGLFAGTLAVFFICVTLLCFIVMLCFYYINKKRQEQINNKLDEDE